MRQESTHIVEGILGDIGQPSNKVLVRVVHDQAQPLVGHWSLHRHSTIGVLGHGPEW